MISFDLISLNQTHLKKWHYLKNIDYEECKYPILVIVYHRFGGKKFAKAET